jgi:hypothetical protein
MRLLAGHANTFVVCFPGLFSTDKATQQLAQGMADAMGRECCRQAAALSRRP